MQNYKVIHGNSSVKSSRTIINDDIQTAISNNSGTAFPTANLVEGMKCYRTDLKRTFTLVDVDTKKWEPDDAGGTAKTANKLTTARTINVTGKATGSAQFDGSADINIKLTTVNADTATTATVANSAKACTGNSVTASQVAWNGVIGKPSSYPPRITMMHHIHRPRARGLAARGTSMSRARRAAYRGRTCRDALARWNRTMPITNGMRWAMISIWATTISAAACA